MSPADARKPAPGFRYFIDNGAWSAHQRGEQLDTDAFDKYVQRYAEGADFIVAPDIVAGGLASLKLSLSYLPKLPREKLKLLAVQDGMEARDLAIAGILTSDDEFGPMGLFVGGSTQWKLETLDFWGALASDVGCHLHCARVNSAQRIARCSLAGVDSIDGTHLIYAPDDAPRLSSRMRQKALFEVRDIFAPLEDS